MWQNECECECEDFQPSSESAIIRHRVPETKKEKEKKKYKTKRVYSVAYRGTLYMIPLLYNNASICIKMKKKSGKSTLNESITMRTEQHNNSAKPDMNANKLCG